MVQVYSKLEGNHRHATSTLLAGLVAHRYADASTKLYQPIDLMDDMRREYGITMSYKKALVVKRKAMSKLYGSDDESYHLLPAMFYMLEKNNPGDMCIISDRHDGILFAVDKVFPSIPHCYFTEHILRNLKGKFKGKSKSIEWKFRAASRAATVEECEEYLLMLDEDDPHIRVYLDKIGVAKRSRSKLVEFLCGRVQRWFHERAEIASSTRTLLPMKRENELIQLQRDAFRMKVNASCSYEFEVTDNDSRSFIVNLKEKTCTCCEFQLDKFVCVHAVETIGKPLGLSCYKFISTFYELEALVCTYAGIVHPVSDVSGWVIPQEILSRKCDPPSCNKKGIFLWVEVLECGISEQVLLRLVGLEFSGCNGLLSTRIGEGQSTSRPPLFDGTNYTYWKERMRIYIRSTNFQLWLVIKNGEETPMKKVDEKLVPKTEDEFDAEDIKKVESYAKAINMLYCAVNPDDYRKISCCTTAKEMWDKLEVTYEGTDQVREAKIDFLTQEYEMFRMKEHEKIDDMFDRFSKIVNDLHALKKTYTDRDLVRKILRSLKSEWRSKADAIYESIGTSNVTIDGLRGTVQSEEIRKSGGTSDGWVIPSLGGKLLAFKTPLPIDGNFLPSMGY
ncbi:unnamed protein product [Cuscuta campestris]|uniref:SWIM-type domain-containing protein n=1 Tax=Cuscuta campestris TaxID=132261 RepID=A0A484LMR3_9ASTE|nr:unnamed protein product [Cuscuta campestris]